ncbi:MAG: glutamine-hydrolyzing GMP synthase [Acidobacteria bacterium]|nr:glutamine-hydrolyzing GMP synthase [Acidobacteriota bacterium]
MKKKANWIAILDFGSQYTQLIARRIRELSVYSEIFPYNYSIEKILKHEPAGIILSGGPDSVYADGAPRPDNAIFDTGIPMLGICYGMQLIAEMTGGKTSGSNRREYGYSKLEIDSKSKLLKGLGKKEDVWMSHGDKVTEMPPDFAKTGYTDNIEIGAMENHEKKMYGIQFHPEVHHTPRGMDIFKNFIFDICGLKPNWTMSSFVADSVNQLKTKHKTGNIILGLSGGVDSSVAAVLLNKAFGDRLYSIFINNGLLRKNEETEVVEVFKDKIGLNLIYADYSDLFLKKLEGVTDPEKKRKIIGETFIRCFEKEAKKIGDVKYLAQGTLYPDVIESVSVKGPADVIKSHHNVGGLPDKMDLELIEPLRELFKDEVRAVGRELGIPDIILGRHPFPGPGLAVRVLGDITKERADLLREADAIFIQELKDSDWYNKIWQAFVVLLPVQSVGVMGDERTYENVAAIRAVHSVDGMTADWVKIPYDLLAKVSSRIVNEIKGINRVVYDITSKPPGTIEWE